MGVLGVGGSPQPWYVWVCEEVGGRAPKGRKEKAEAWELTGLPFQSSPAASASPREVHTCSIQRENQEVGQAENLLEEGAHGSGRTRRQLAKEAGGGWK